MTLPLLRLLSHLLEVRSITTPAWCLHLASAERLLWSVCLSPIHVCRLLSPILIAKFNLKPLFRHIFKIPCLPGTLHG